MDEKTLQQKIYEHHKELSKKLGSPEECEFLTYVSTSEGPLIMIERIRKNKMNKQLK
ncbi:MAG: hypothetical protein ACLSV2_04910 [Clostridium sp.]